MQAYACPRCGKKTSGDYLSWKGGVNQAICDSCEQAEKEKEQERKNPAGATGTRSHGDVSPGSPVALED